MNCPRKRACLFVLWLLRVSYKTKGILGGSKLTCRYWSLIASRACVLSYFSYVRLFVDSKATNQQNVIILNKSKSCSRPDTSRRWQYKAGLDSKGMNIVKGEGWRGRQLFYFTVMVLRWDCLSNQNLYTNNRHWCDKVSVRFSGSGHRTFQRKYRD